MDASGQTGMPLPLDEARSVRPVVFVVDDEPGILQLCQRLLSKANFQVITFSNPQESIQAFESRKLDLLLVDIRMPGVDGFQVIDAARQHQPDLAVVVMTGFGTVETAIEALRRGAEGLVLKPFSGVELVQSVQRALEQSQHKQDVMRLQALRPLFDVTETLFTETNPKRLQAMILEAVCGHLHCALAEIYQAGVIDRRGQAGEKEPETQERDRHRRLKLVTSLSLAEHETSAPPRQSTNISVELLARRAYLQRTPLLLTQAAAGDPHLVEVLNNRDLGSVMCVPIGLSSRQATSGVLLAARSCDQPNFREADLEMLLILARQASVALENAHLHAELRAYIQQLEDSQRALIQAEKMAIAGRLTASIAHEINNPLQAVQNCLHLAGRQELDAQQRQGYLEMANSELDRLMQTVQRMLDFYRPTALDRKPTDINQVLERVLNLIQKQLRDRNIHLHLSLSPRLPTLLAVGDQLQQVFLNLLLNAMEAMPEGGELFIATNLSGPPGIEHASPAEVEILIEDTGPGVPPSQRKHIFEPFVSSKASGTGLGLAVSYGIITAHGGNLELVEARRLEGKRGACFRVSLPILEFA